MKKLSGSKICTGVALLGAAFLAAGTAKAQTFTVGTYTDASVLSLAGTAANELDGGYGANFGNGGDETVNGYTFADAGPFNSGSNTDLEGFGAGYTKFLTDGSSDTVVVTTGNANFDAVVGSGNYNGNTATLTFNNLTDDTKYIALFLTDDDRVHNSGASYVTIVDNSLSSDMIFGGYGGGTGSASASNPSLNQFEGAYLTDTFTASGTSHTITFNGSYFNAVLLEKVPATPEPATYALLGLGLAVLIMTVRNRRASSN